MVTIRGRSKMMSHFRREGGAELSVTSRDIGVRGFDPIHRTIKLG